MCLKMIWGWHSVKTASKYLHPNSSGKYFICKKTGHPRTTETHDKSKQDKRQLSVVTITTVMHPRFCDPPLTFSSTSSKYTVLLYNLFHTGISKLKYFSCSFILFPVLFTFFYSNLTTHEHMHEIAHFWVKTGQFRIKTSHVDQSLSTGLFE